MHTKFFGCDWGTSSFRLRLIDIDSGTVLASTASADGIAGIYASWKTSGRNENERTRFYTSVLETHLQQIAQDTGINVDGLPIVVTGMASSSIGMLELPYTVLPFSLDGKGIEYRLIKENSVFNHELLLVSGARSSDDVMRGEETQLLGCHILVNNANGIFIFPGTHSKHLQTAGGQATGITTYMTGEFFQLLTENSILANSVTKADSLEQAVNKNAFVHGVESSRSQNILHNCFTVRTNQLFQRLTATENYCYMSGLLIGSELSSLTQSGGLIVLVGETRLVMAYQLALEVMAVPAKVITVDAATATVQGQCLLYKRAYA